MTLGSILINKLKKFKENIIKAIPTPNNETPLSDVNNGNKGKSPNYARSDHQHPKSTLYAEANHIHSASELPSVVDVVQNGNSNAVTSNAVYDYVDSVIGDADDWLTS